MDAYELYEKHEHIAKETLFRMFTHPKGIARKHKIEFADLLQYARLGLWIAATTYDQSKAKFITHAINHIKWKVTTSLERECMPMKVNPNNRVWVDNMYTFISIEENINASDSYDVKTYHDIIASDLDTVEEAFDNIYSSRITDNLDETQLEILRLKEEGLSYDKIGDLWNMTGANVQAKIYKARKKVRECLEEAM